MSDSKNTKIQNSLDIARTLHKNGQLPQAMAAYKKILRLLPTHPDALHYLGIAYYQTGNTDAAIVSVQRAIALAPNYLDAMNNLANIYKETGRLLEAQALYTHLLIGAPDHVNALINMAVILREAKQTNDALKFIHRALTLQPESAIAQHNLGNIYADLQQFELAETAYRYALELNPLNHQAAKRLAYVLNKLGRIAESIVLLNAVVMKYPDDAVAQHLLAAYSNNDVPDRASDLYIKQTFDDYSANFDLALAQLRYQVPQLISAQLLARVAQSEAGIDILDIGCGTGLCAPLIKHMARSLIGVDLSAKMLAKAAQLKLYDELHEHELSDFMQRSSRQFDAVICADTLVYFGDLQQVCSTVFGVLQPGGYFIFSVEQHPEVQLDHHYVLQVNGRYSHHKSYVDEALQAAGFYICQIQDIVPRLESGKEVDGALIVAQKRPLNTAMPTENK
jgi:predicted TPR repeat methyltransferase